ncbi:SRPBCC family protein [Daejeonella lutea]|uniref:Activator of Hsp90 ATPase homolog 1-like protein n=1 Tax=Daejeonella lutea TaxID=572036 RepID=A0A1T5AA72_9SPHI|nr:SRPBCC domain-containing protein [Daejeonella lutea]SKB31573.1 Activator of Hsp90 ATPase homolog 1-like protein [Daejeonella lutea]
MNDFDWTSFTKRIAIRAGIAEIYDAWTKSEELQKWFLEKATFYNSDKSLEPRVSAYAGNSYTWIWYLYEDAMNGRITAANWKDFLQFTFEGECLVDVKLSEDNGYTIVELRHHNIPTDDNSKKFIRLGCSNGWGFYLTNLKSIYEGGIDLRNKDSNLSPMINN